MVVDPHHADGHEAGEKGEIRPPQVQQRGPERSRREVFRQTDLQDEQRHRDGEDAVAERFQPRRLFRYFSRYQLLTLHASPSPSHASRARSNVPSKTGNTTSSAPPRPS